MKLLITTIALALAAQAAQAQNTPAAILSWKAPTTLSDGVTPLPPGTLYYRVFQGPPGGPEVQLPTVVVGLSYNVTAAFTGTQCWTVTASLWQDGQESLHSAPPVCKTIAVGPPPVKRLAPPSGVSVQ